MAVMSLSNFLRWITYRQIVLFELKDINGIISTYLYSCEVPLKSVKMHLG